MSEATADGTIDYAVLAIPNTIAGSILPNYGFIEEFGLKYLAKSAYVSDVFTLGGERIILQPI